MERWEDKFVRILEANDWIIDYDKENKRYRVSYFEDCHFVDECWFDDYEEKEVDGKIAKIIDILEELKINFKDGLTRKRKVIDEKGMEYFLDKLITIIKNLE